MGSDLRLQPGVGFHLGPDGQWGVEDIPPGVLRDAEESGRLIIEGYRSVVFETPDGDMWAQKEPGAAASVFSQRSSMGRLAPRGAEVAAERAASARIASKELYAMDDVQKTQLISNFRMWSAGDPSKWADEIPHFAEYYARTEEGAGLPAGEIAAALTAEFAGPAHKVGSACIASRVASLWLGRTATRGGNITLKELRRSYPGAYEALPGEVVGHEVELLALFEEPDGVVMKTSEGEYSWDGEAWNREGPAIPRGLDPIRQEPAYEAAQESLASRISARWLESKKRKRDVTSLVQKIMDRPGDDREYEKEIAAYGKRVRKSSDRIQSAFEKLAGDLGRIAESLGGEGHDKVMAHHAEIVREQFGKAVSTTQVAANSLIRNLRKRADEWDPSGAKASD